MLSARSASLSLSLLIPLLGVAAPVARADRAPAAASVALAVAPPPPAASGSASASARKPFGPVGVAPDPTPLETRWRWVYDIVYHEGAVFAPTPRLRELSRPAATPRRMGRFAIELFNGPDLVDRVRFEVPLLDGDPYSGRERPRWAGPDLERHVRTHVTVEVPASDRANRAYWVDRATGARVRLPWPTPPASSR